MYFRNDTVNIGSETDSGDRGVDPLDPNWVNVNIDYNDGAAYKKLKRMLSVQKDVALIVQSRKKAAAFAQMERAQREIIR